MGKQNVGDLEEIRQNLESWLAKQLGKGSDFDIGELNFPEASGESSVTLLFNAKWSGGEDKFVLRMVPKESEVFESHNLKLQFDVMKIAGQHGIPVPGLVAYEANPDLLGSDFYVMNFNAGLIPPDNPPMAFGSWVSELNTEQRATMWNHGLDLLVDIHSLPVEAFDQIGLPQAAMDESPAAHELRQYERLLELGIRDSADPIIEQAWTFIKNNAPQAGARRLCWGDSRPGNIIYKDLKPVAVLDWELASIGNPLTDLAWYFWIDHTNSVGLGAEKMTGVPDYNEAYQRWSEATGLPIDDMPWYELFVMWRFAVIMEKKMMAMAKVDANFADFPNHASPLVAPLLEKCS
ncbi:MAG: phosphotransferase family protein [Pseudomonadales bacterium]